MVYLMKLTQEEEGQTGSGVATKQDIENLGDKLVWPPEFTRDSKLKKMQSLIDKEDAVMDNVSLTDTEKVLKVGELKRQFNVYNDDIPLRLGAVPPVPLIKSENVPKYETYSEDEGDYEDESDYEADREDLPEQTEIHAATFLKSIADYRKPKGKLMLKKLAAAGLLKWDGSGNVFYNGQPIEGASMGELVHYFQTAHKRRSIKPPVGQVMFSQALRHAGAMEDVQLGGQHDEQVRQVFKGITPARAQKRRAGRFSPHSSSASGLHKSGDKTVEQLEL